MTKYIARPFVVLAEPILDEDQKPTDRMLVQFGNSEPGPMPKAEFDKMFILASNSPHSAGF